jgi:hypothetical protein
MFTNTPWWTKLHQEAKISASFHKMTDSSHGAQAVGPCDWQIPQLMKATEISGAKWHSRLTAGVKNAHSFIHATKTGCFKTMATEMLTYCYKHSVHIRNIFFKEISFPLHRKETESLLQRPVTIWLKQNTEIFTFLERNIAKHRCNVRALSTHTER